MSHGKRHAVRGVDDLDIFSCVRWNGSKCFTNSFDCGFDESGMVKESPQFINFRRALPNLALRSSNVFAILSAPGVGTIGRSDESHSPPDAILLHPSQRVS